MTFKKNIVPSLFTNRWLISQRVLFVPVSLLFAVTAVNLQSCPASTVKMGNPTDYKSAASIYDFTVKDTHGNDVKLDKYEGHVVLIVNIASQCGLTTSNYAKLSQLKDKYYESGLRILSFPCNQFGSQMPEEDGEAMECHLKSAKAEFGDLFMKIDVNGDNASPLFRYLKYKQAGILGNSLKWNFTKFLVDKKGQPVDRFAPTTDPMDIASSIEKLL